MGGNGILLLKCGKKLINNVGRQQVKPKRKSPLKYTAKKEIRLGKFHEIPKLGEKYFIF